MNKAVILARGGSKGCPGKNKRKLKGIPLVVRAVKACQLSGVIDEVCVGSDDQEIRTLASKAGASVVHTAEMGDTQVQENVLIETPELIGDADCFALIQCTAPFMTSGDIAGSWKHLIDQGADSCTVVAPFHGIVWDLNNLPHGQRIPRQQQYPRFLEVGSVYWMRAESFLNERTRFCGRTVMYRIHPERAFEIDTEADFRIAEHLMDCKGFTGRMELDNGLT